MNTTVLKAAASHGGPLVLAAGVAMLASALVDSGRGLGPVAAGPTPVPTVTVTASPPAPVAAPSAGPPAVASPSLVPAGPAPARSTAVRPVAAQQTSPGRIRPPQSPVPGGSSSAPGTGPTSPSGCEGAVSARLRLGVLPRCAITIQGR